MVSEAEVILGLLEPLEVGDVLTYRQIEEATGKPIRNCRGAVLRAGRQLLKTKNRLVRCEVNNGYRIAKPEECTAVATQRHRSANRQLTQAKEAVQFVDMSGLTPEQRTLALGMFRTLAGMCAAIRHLNAKSQEHDAAISAVRSDQTELVERVERLEKLFQRPTE
jgi:gamma-glutamyl phosphate reductase